MKMSWLKEEVQRALFTMTSILFDSRSRKDCSDQLTKERNPMPDKSCQFAKQAGGVMEEKRRRNETKTGGPEFVLGVAGGCWCLKSPLIPGDHLFLLVGGIAAAAQVLVGRGQEVEGVILEVLVDEREENLRRVKTERKLCLCYRCWR